MKKIVEKIKNSKKLILGILIGALTINIIEFVVTLAANSVSSDIVLYNSSTGKKNVKDAIDELYTMASSHCPDGYNCVNTQTCISPRCTDNDSNGYVTVGDLITYGTENFFVIGINGGTIKLWPKYNLIKSTTNPLQQVSPDSSTLYDNAITFSDSQYWSTTGFVYNSQSNLYPYIEAYKENLKKLGANVIEATLISEEELDYLRKYSWISAPAYWTGTTTSNISRLAVSYIHQDAEFNSNNFADGNGCMSSCMRPSVELSTCKQQCGSRFIGIRPIIIISASSL